MAAVVCGGGLDSKLNRDVGQGDAERLLLCARHVVADEVEAGEGVEVA